MTLINYTGNDSRRNGNFLHVDTVKLNDNSIKTITPEHHQSLLFLMLIILIFLFVSLFFCCFFYCAKGGLLRGVKELYGMREIWHEMNIKGNLFLERGEREKRKISFIVNEE